MLLTQLPGAAASHVRQVAVPFSYVPHATATRSAGARAPSLAPAGRPVEVAFTLSCANGGSSRLEPQMQGGCISRCGSGSGIGPERRRRRRRAQRLWAPPNPAFTGCLQSRDSPGQPLGQRRCRRVEPRTPRLRTAREEQLAAEVDLGVALCVL